ncbi:hypothetical protein QTP88_003052 [Uroleucon formosanum]
MIKKYLKETTPKITKKKIKEYLGGLDQNKDINHYWEKMGNAIKRSAEEVLGHEPRIKRKSWFNEQCKEAVADRDKARLRVIQDPTEENKRRLAIRQREAKRIIKMNKRLWEKGKVKEIEDNRKSNTRIFFEKANERDLPTHTSYKVLSNVLLNRLKPYIKEIIGDYQVGFMAGKSTLDQIHVVKQIIEKSHEFDKDVHLLFVDFKAAYGSVNRERLLKVIDQLGILRKIIRMIRACMNGSKCKVKYGGEESEKFEVRTGLRQGDALSPALFNIALESAIRETLGGATGIKIGNDQQLVVAGYADNVIIMAEIGDDINAKNTQWDSRTNNPRGNIINALGQSRNYKMHASPSPTYWPTSRRKKLDILDIFLTKVPNILHSIVTNLDDLCSDHSSVFLTIDTMPPKKPNKPTLTQGTMDWVIFRSSLENKINLNISLKSPNDIDEAVNFLTKSIQETAWSCSSPPTPKSTTKNLSLYTRSLIAEKRRAQATWQRTRYPSDKRVFNNLTNKLKRHLAQIRSENFAKHLIALSSSDNTLWQTTRKILRSQPPFPLLRKADGT